MPATADHESEAIRANLARLAHEGLPLRDFGQECIAELSRHIAIDVAAACVLAPEAHYEQFVTCWPAWAADALDGRAFTTPANREDHTRDHPEGYGYPITAARGRAREICAEHGITRIYAIPIVLEEGEYVGSFIIGRGEGDRFTDPELGLARLAAAALKPALRRHIEHQHAQLRVQSAAAISKLAIMVNTGDRLETFYAEAMPVLRGVLPLDFTMLRLTDEGGFLRIAASDLPEAFPPGEVSEYSREWLADFVQEQATIAEIDVAALAEERAPRLRANGFARAAVAPIVRDGDLLGLFVVARRTPWAFSEAERAFLELFVALLTQAAAAHHRIEQAAAEAREQRFVANLAETVAAASTPAEIVGTLQSAFTDILPAPRVGYGYLDNGELVQPHGTPGPERWPIGPYMREAIEHGQVVPPRGAPDALPGTVQALRRAGIDAVCVTASVAGGKPTGLLVVASGEQGYDFGPRELRLFRIAARILGPAMENVRKMEAALEEAKEERLTADIARAAAGATSPFELVAALREPFSRIVPEPRIGFGYIEGGDIVFPSAQYEQELRFPIARNVSMTEAISNGQAVMPARAVSWNPPPGPKQLPPAVSAVALTAAQSNGVATGVLAVRSSLADVDFSPRQLRLFRLLADIVGTAMSNVRSAEQAREEAAEQRLIAEVAAVAARESDLNALAGALKAALNPFVQEARAGFATLEGSVARLASSAGDLVVQLTSAETQTFKSGQAVRINPPSPAEPEFEIVTAGPTCAAMVLTQMAIHGEAVDAMWVTSHEPGFQFNSRTLRLLRVVADVLGPALAHARGVDQLGRENALQQLLLNSVTEAVILFDHNLGIAFSNEGGQALHRAVDPDQRAANLSEVGAALPEEARALIFSAMTTGQRTRGRSRLVVDGQVRWFDYENIPLDHPEFGMLLLASDVTAEATRAEEQRRHRQQLEQSARLAALGELVGGVAHELNNPLTAILGFSEVMAGQGAGGQFSAGGEFSEEIEIIRHEATRARDIVRDLLSFSRPSPSRRAPVDLEQVIAHVVRLRRASWERLGIDGAVDCSRLTGPIWADAQQITQVILNLVTNAEHALKGRPDAQLSIEAATGGGRASIIVADNGVGMEPPILGRIFEPFFSTKQGDGTGLGLSLSYSIAKSHRGTLEAESEPGVSTRFTLDLPADPIEEMTAAEGTASKPPRQAHVLVVDDEPNLRKLSQRLITTMGHSCETAETVELALAMVATTDFDLILCDYRLGPETADAMIEGLEVIAPAMVAKTVIATGATTDSRVLELCGRHGLRLIAKPYGSSELAEMVAAA